MAKERKLCVLHLYFDSMRREEESNRQLNDLQQHLNEGWNVLQSIPLAAAAGRPPSW